MNRTLTYHITEQESCQTIEQFLRGKGYSSQCIKELKKQWGSISIDDEPQYMKVALQEGCTLTVHIQEESSSEKIPPVELPLDIIYEDEDLLVINKPADMPIHPSLNNYENSLANALPGTFPSRISPLCSAVSIVWTGIPPD